MISFNPFTLNMRGKLFYYTRPQVMGIINVTPDSFYAGSRTNNADAIRNRASKMVEDGVDFFDIGGYSSRPGADEVTPDEELSRLATGLDILKHEWSEIPVSIDTFRAEVAKRCVEDYGAEIINDISGGDLDPEMYATVAELKVPYIAMHTRGTPDTMQNLTKYNDVTAEVLSDLAHKISRLHALGVADVIADPGFGFAKTLDQNYSLMANLEAFHSLGVPLLIGVSHKSMIYKLLNTSPDEATNGTVVLNTIGLFNGASFIRVHDVGQAVETVKIIGALSRNSRTYV